MRTTNILAAAFEGDLDRVKTALDIGADIESVESTYGNTPLMLAAYKNHSTVVELLIKSGADLHALCYGKNTPLFKASMGDSTESARLLIAAGANVDHQDPEGFTPLMLSVTLESLELVQLLVNAGANLNIKSSDGETALDMAVFYENDEIIKFLRSEGALEGGSPNTSQAVFDSLEEASANFDLEQVGPFLRRVSTQIDEGFGPVEIQKFVAIVDSMSHDDEESMGFHVTFRGRGMPLVIRIHMSDINSPDVYFFSHEGLAKVIEEEMTRMEE